LDGALEYRTGDFSPQALYTTPGYGTDFKTFGEMMIRNARLIENTPGYRAPRQTARQIDAELERMTPEDFRREVRAVRDYYRKLIPAAELPYREQLENLPKPDGFFLNLPGSSHHQLALSWARSQTGLRLALGLAVVRRWQHTEATDPPDLETAFRSAGFDRVPTDPFGDGPIRMAILDGRAVVYSVGADGRNNASQHGDFNLRLHPLLPSTSVPTRSTAASEAATVSGRETPTNQPAPPQPPPAKPFPGSFKLVRVLGADVYLHWLWFLAAVILIRDRPVQYSSFVWDVIAYVGGFGIVLLHEFGHVLACRRVGGVADRVLLWPLGGLALAAPPQRPGAQLWTTVAGPLVNVLLAPLLIGLAWLLRPTEPPTATPDVFFLVREWADFNVLILVFNLLPIFPLDGGRIVFSVLWLVMGRAKALATASVLGLLSGGAIAVYAGMFTLWWLLVTALFICYGAVSGLRAARRLAPIDRAPRREEFTCPGCGLHPAVGAFWNCTHCRLPTDAFDPLQLCPRCEMVFTAVVCQECGRQFVGAEWSDASTDSPGE
jgi:Zn-dependent protease